MEEHLKNVRQEVGHTNALMAAKKKEIATEEHLCALAAREAGRYGVGETKFVLHSELCSTLVLLSARVIRKYFIFLTKKHSHPISASFVGFLVGGREVAIATRQTSLFEDPNGDTTEQQIHE